MTRGALSDTRLEAIAGAPILDASEITGVAIIGNLPASDVSIYNVWQDPVTGHTSGIHEAYGASLERGYRLMFDNPSDTKVQLGRFSPTPALATTLYPEFPASTKHVSGCSIRRNTLSMAIRVDADALKSVTNAGAAYPLDGLPLRVGSRDALANPDIVTHRIVVYPMYHDDATRVRIMRWLAIRYGAPSV